MTQHIYKEGKRVERQRGGSSEGEQRPLERGKLSELLTNDTTNRVKGKKGWDKPSSGLGGKGKTGTARLPSQRLGSRPITYHLSPGTPQKAAAALAPDLPSTVQYGFLSCLRRCQWKSGPQKQTEDPLSQCPPEHMSLYLWKSLTLSASPSRTRWWMTCLRVRGVFSWAKMTSTTS